MVLDQSKYDKFFYNLKISKEKRDNESVHMTIDLILNEFLDDIENKNISTIKDAQLLGSKIKKEIKTDLEMWYM